MNKYLDAFKETNLLTVLIVLKDDLTLNVNDFPKLKELGYWVKTNNHTNLYLRTTLGKPEIVKKFSEITGLEPSKFEVGAINSLAMIW